MKMKKSCGVWTGVLIAAVAVLAGCGGGGGGGGVGIAPGGGGGGQNTFTIQGGVKFSGGVTSANVSVFRTDLTLVSSETVNTTTNTSFSFPVGSGTYFYLVTDSGQNGADTVRPQWGAVNLAQSDTVVTTNLTITGINDTPSAQEVDSEALSAVHFARAANGVRALPALANLALGLGGVGFSPQHASPIQRLDIPLSSNPTGPRIVRSAPFPSSAITITAPGIRPAVDVHGNVWVTTGSDVAQELANANGSVLATFSTATPGGTVNSFFGGLLAIDSRSAHPTNNVGVEDVTFQVPAAAEQEVALIPGGSGAPVISGVPFSSPTPPSGQTPDFQLGQMAAIPGGSFLIDDIEGTTTGTVPGAKLMNSAGVVTPLQLPNGFPNVNLGDIAVASDGSVLIADLEVSNGNGGFSQCHIRVFTVGAGTLTQTADFNESNTLGFPFTQGQGNQAPFLVADRVHPNHFIASGPTGVVELAFTPGTPPSLAVVKSIAPAGVGFCTDGDVDPSGNIWVADHQNLQAVRFDQNGNNVLVAASSLNTVGVTVDQDSNAWFRTTTGLTRIAVGLPVVKNVLPDGSTLTTQTINGVTTITQTFANGFTNTVTFLAQTNATSATVNTTSSALSGTQGQIQLSLAGGVLTAISSAFDGFDGVPVNATTTVQSDGSMTINGQVLGAAGGIVLASFTATLTAPDAAGDVTETLTLANPTFVGAAIAGNITITITYDGQGNMTAFNIQDPSRNMDVSGTGSGAAALQNNNFSINVTPHLSATTLATVTDAALTDALVAVTASAPTVPTIVVPPPDVTTGTTSVTASLVDVTNGTTFDATTVDQGIEGGTFPGGMGASTEIDAGLNTGLVADGGLSGGGSLPDDPKRR